MQNLNQKKVLIVGGGLAGLCCARVLQSANVPVQIFEAAAEVGGRIRTDQQKGFLLDRGFQVFLTSYPEAQQVLDYQQLALGYFEPGALIRFNGRFHPFRDPWRRPLSAWSTLFSPVASIRDKARVARLRLDVTRGSLDRLLERPQTTTLERLQQLGFSNQIIDRFFRPFFGGVFLESNLETSSIKFDYLFRMFSTGLATLPRQGMQAIPRQIAEQLAPGTVELNAPVRSIGEGHVELEDGRVETGSHVVLATAADVAGRLLGTTSEPRFHEVECHYFSASQSPLDSKSLVLNGEGVGPINSLCVPSDIVADYAPADRALISVTVLSEHFRETPENIISEIRSQLRDWFGGDAEEWEHLKSYRVRHALPHQTPAELNPVIKSPLVAGTTYRCGDDQGISSIQGAMESGRRTAEALLASRGD